MYGEFGGGGGRAPFTAKTSPLFGENALIAQLLVPRFESRDGWHSFVQRWFHVKLRNGLRELTSFPEHCMHLYQVNGIANFKADVDDNTSSKSPRLLEIACRQLDEPLCVHPTDGLWDPQPEMAKR